MRLGFLSYDFNDHPTAHLLEAIFETVATYTSAATGCGNLYLPTNSDSTCNTDNCSTTISPNCSSTTNSYCNSNISNNSGISSRSLRGTVFDDVELVVFSYGKDDGSVYRKQLKKVRIMTLIS